MFHASPFFIEVLLSYITMKIKKNTQLIKKNLNFFQPTLHKLLSYCIYKFNSKNSMNNLRWRIVTKQIIDFHFYYFHIVFFFCHLICIVYTKVHTKSYPFIYKSIKKSCHLRVMCINKKAQHIKYLRRLYSRVVKTIKF